MAAVDGSPTTTAIAPLLLRNLITSIFFYADKSLLNLSEKYKLLEIIHSLLVSFFLFFLGILPSFSSYFIVSSRDDHHHHLIKPSKSKPDNFVSASTACGGADSGIARALSQLLSIVNDIPVSSRKYEVVRSLAEKIIDDNLLEGYEALREVNRTVLSAAFERTLGQLEAAAVENQEIGDGNYGPGPGSGSGPVDYGLGWVLRAVRYVGDVAWSRVVKPSRMDNEFVGRLGSCGEKLAAELLWLAQKLAACGYPEEAVCRWASASNLAWMALSAEPRLQGSLVKVSAFLIKQAKDIGREGEEGAEEGTKEQQKQLKMKLLMSWLPLLCRASNGTDVPTLSSSEKAELERILEEIVDKLEEEEEQEKVLSLWLHHFTYCPSSDWPNLHACYARWCTASRKLLLLQ